MHTKCRVVLSLLLRWLSCWLGGGRPEGEDAAAAGAQPEQFDVVVEASGSPGGCDRCAPYPRDIFRNHFSTIATGMRSAL